MIPRHCRQPKLKPSEAFKTLGNVLKAYVCDKLSLQAFKGLNLQAYTGL